MFKFLAGVVVGAGGLYFYSNNVRKNVKEANQEIKELINNRNELNHAVNSIILEKLENGEIDEMIRNANENIHNMKTINSL